MDSIVVLLSAYNGCNFLKEQLDSLEAQVGVDMKVLVRDDGSTDGTQELLESLESRKQLTWYQGDNLGPAMSFLDLINKAPDAEYYAFCDQDDVWMPDKLTVAIKKLKDNNADFYYSSYTTVDGALNILDENVRHHHKDTFGSSLVNLEVTGCTVVFTKKLLDTVRLYKPQRIMMHDSWMYKIALGLGYRVFYDSKSHIFYRQHGNNVLGYKRSFSKRMKSIYRRWFKKVSNDRYMECKELYNGYKEMMSPKQKVVLESIIGYREKNIFRRLRIALAPSFRTGISKTNIVFAVSIISKRF